MGGVSEWVGVRDSKKYKLLLTYSLLTMKTWVASARHAVGTEARLLKVTPQEGTERIEHSPAQGSGSGSGSDSV